MSRHAYQGTFKDLNGAVVGALTTSDGNDGTVTVYLAGGTTLADVYAASSGGTAVNSVSTNDYGHFIFYVDDSEYPPTQLFKIILSHGDFQSKTYDNLRIITDDPYKYYCDATATNQGAATTRADRSLKDLIDAITTYSADIVLANSSGTGTTTYTVTTSETSPTNIQLNVENGAIIDGAGTLTINGPFDAGLYRVFGTSIAVVFGAGAVEAVLPEWFASSGTGTSADPYVVDFAQVDAAAVNNQTVQFANYAYYQISSPPWVMTNTVNLFGRGVIVNAGVAAETALYCPTDNWRNFRDVRIDGNAASGIGVHLFNNFRWNFDNVFIYQHGTTGLKIEGSYIGTMTGGAVKESGADGILIIDEPVAGNPSNALNFIGVLVENNTDSNYIMSLDTNISNNINILGGTIENGGTGITLAAGAATRVRVASVYFEGFSTDNAILSSCDRLTIQDAHLSGGSATMQITAGRSVVIDGVSHYGSGEKIVFAANDAVVKNMFLDTSSTTACPSIVEQGLSNRGIKGTGNLLRNGNFISRNAGETSVPTHWALYQTPTLAIAAAPTKASGNAMSCTAAGTTYEGISQTIDLEIPDGEEKLITISALVKCTAGDSARIGAELTGGIHSITLTNTAWERHSFQVKVLDGETSIRVSLAAAADGDVVWFSEVQMVESNDIKGWLTNPLDTPDALEMSFTFNPGDLADGVGETKSVTVTGAALGDFVMVAAPYDLQDLIATAYVQAANTVEVRVQNENAGANVNLASGTWKVKVLK